jgi:hypothetical protein
MFWVLWLTDRTYLYLSTRTAKWLVPMGAVIMSVAAIGRLATARTAHDEPLGRRRSWMLGMITVPVVLVLALPPTALGAYSVGKRATFGGSAIGATARDVTGPLDFVDIGAAQSFPAAMQQLEASRRRAHHPRGVRDARGERPARRDRADPLHHDLLRGRRDDRPGPRCGLPQATTRTRNGSASPARCIRSGARCSSPPISGRTDPRASSPYLTP